MATIRDVAKLAGVAPITVSRVLNKSSYVGAETRRKVEWATDQLGYVPNSLARSLRWHHTGTLALIVSDITNPYFTTVARGVEDAAHEAGLSLIVCNSDEEEDKQERYLRLLLQKQVDGILLVPARSAIEPLQPIQRQHVPVVVVDRRMPGACADIVRCDSEAAAYELTRLLVSLGHRRIAMLAGPEAVSTSADRAAGYRRALGEAGWVVYGRFTVASGYEMARQFLAHEPRPTAFFAANNFIAIGVLKALRDAGLRVPEDAAVVAFDDLPAGLVVDPFLTVAVQPAYEMGRRATELLRVRMAHPAAGDRQEIIMPIDIVVRRSSGSIEGASHE